MMLSPFFWVCVCDNDASFVCDSDAFQIWEQTKIKDTNQDPKTMLFNELKG